MLSIRIAPCIRRCLTAIALGSVVLAPALAFAFDTDADGVSDEADAFPCNARATGVVHVPYQSGWGMLMVEDQWPEKGDLDFNDASIAHNYQFEVDAQGRVLAVRISYNILALGGIFDNGLALHLPVPTDSVSSIQMTVNREAPVALTPVNSEPELTVQLLDNMRRVFGNAAGTINSDKQKTDLTALPVLVEIEFASPVALDTSLAPYDLFIFRSEAPSHEIHRPEFSGTGAMNQGLFHSKDDGSTLGRHFVDTDGLPFIINLPELRPWPQEGVSIEHLYPNITQFVASGGTQARDFYTNGVDLHYAMRWTPYDYGMTGDSPLAVSAWEPPYDPAVSRAAYFSSDTSCVQVWDESVRFGVTRDTFGYSSAMDGSGNFIIVGSTKRTFSGQSNLGQDDAFIAKYNRTGALLWSRQFGGSQGDIARAVTLDASGNIYVAGETRSASFTGAPEANTGSYDGFVARFDANGTQSWAHLIGTTGADYATGIVLDSSGNIFVAGGGADLPMGGAAAPGNGGPSSFVARYDASGSRLWVRRYLSQTNPAVDYNYASDLAIDPSNNLILAGTMRVYAQSHGASDRAFAAKVSSTDGTLQWFAPIGPDSDNHGSSDYSFSHSLGVTTDSTGAVYVAGTWSAGSQVTCRSTWCRTLGDTSSNFTLTKLASNNGMPQWTQAVGSTQGAADYALDLKTDASGNVYLVGYTQGAFEGQSSAGSFDYFAARYDASGNRAWLVQNGTSSDDGAFGAAIDPSQGLYILGNSGSIQAGTPVAFQNAYYGFIAQHSLATGARVSLVSTVDTTLARSSCQAILSAGASTGSGIYSIDPDDSGPIAPYDVYCDMTTAGGGWTLVASIANDSNNYWTWSNYPFIGNRTTGTLSTALTRDFQSPAWSSLKGSSVLFKADNSASKYLIYNTMLSNETLQNKYPANSSSTWRMVGSYMPATTVGSWWYQCSNLEMRLMTSDTDGGDQSGTHWDWVDNGVGFIWRSSNNNGCNYDDSYGGITSGPGSSSTELWGTKGIGPYNTGLFFYSQNFTTALNVFVK